MSRTNLAFFALALGLVFSAGNININAATIAGVTIEDFSSQLVVGGFSRGAVRTVDGSGLVAGQHGIVPENTMWLSTGNGVIGGTVADPNQPGAVITFDLGDRYSLNSMRVWNYNENSPPNLTTRGARQVELLAASTVGGPFTSKGIITLSQATGASTYTGQLLDFTALSINLADVRLLRFNILNSHGGDNNFVGLSEVQFDGQLTPEPAAIVSWVLLGIAFAAACVWQRNRQRSVAA